MTMTGKTTGENIASLCHGGITCVVHQVKLMRNRYNPGGK